MKFICMPRKCCVTPLPLQDKHLVKVLEIIEIGNHIPKSGKWTGRPAAEGRAIARSYVEKALFRYPYTRNLIHELQARPNLRLQGIASESTLSDAFAEFAAADLGKIVHDGLEEEYLKKE